MSFDLNILSLIIAVVSGITIHEFAHAYSANRLGDPTARLQGRLTLNPIKHLDPIGSLVFLVLIFTSGLGFGWGRPVPINPYNLRHKQGERWVSLSGPLANFLLAFLVSLILALVPTSVSSFWSEDFFGLIGMIVRVNILLGFFNLIPLPPLDGSKILFSFFPPGKNEIRDFLERYSLPILIFLIIFGFIGVLGSLSNIVSNLLFGLASLLNSLIY